MSHTRKIGGVAALSIATLLVGCAAPETRSVGGGGQGSRGGGGGPGVGGAGGGSGGGGSPGGGTNGCSDASKIIYVVDENGTFSSFTPNQTDISKSTFHDLGVLQCNAGSGYRPFSMSIDRNAVAWVEYVHSSTLGKPGALPNKLFRVSTSDASCTETSFVGGQSAFEAFCMGFAANAAMGSDETLYVAGVIELGVSSTFGRLDLGSFKVDSAGTKMTNVPELSGNGLGELWGFFPDAAKPRVSRVDKTSGAETQSIPLGSAVAGETENWAFAFYGGEFWVFLSKWGDNGLSGVQPTVVYHVTATGVKDQLPTGNRQIVGAGVSTCAPTTPVG